MHVCTKSIFWWKIWENESNYLKLTIFALLHCWRKHFTAISAASLQIVMGSTVPVAPETSKRMLTEV